MRRGRDDAQPQRCACQFQSALRRLNAQRPYELSFWSSLRVEVSVRAAPAQCAESDIAIYTHGLAAEFQSALRRLHAQSGGPATHTVALCAVPVRAAPAESAAPERVRSVPRTDVAPAFAAPPLKTPMDQ